MSPERETWKDAKTRLAQLNHEVDVAREAVTARPTDQAARHKLDMTVSIRDVAARDLDEAKQKLDRSSAKPDDD